MQVIETPKKHIIKIIEDIDQASIERYNQFQCRLMQTTIGNSIEEFNKKMQTLDVYLHKEELKLARAERVLISQNVYSALEKINWQSYAFAVLVNEIDGEVFEDYSDSGLEMILTALKKTDVQNGVVKEKVQEVKKN